MIDPSATVLVTGITGYIGSRIAVDLLNKGYTVRGSMRNPAKADRVRAAIAAEAPTDKLTFVKGNLTEAADWETATQGCRAVLHVASPLAAVAPKDPDELIVPAREGTLNVLRAATAAGVERIVLTSSMAAVAYGMDGSETLPMDESRWTNLDSKDQSAYIASKTIAEKAAWDYVEKTNGAPELVTINPGAVLGPLLTDNPSDSLLIVIKMLRGEFPGLPKMGFMLVDVRDVSDLQIRALESPGAAGKRYLATVDHLTMKDIATILRDAFPDYAGKVTTRQLPDWLLRIAALFDGETAAVLTELGKERLTSSERARNDLGWSPRPAREAVIATGRDAIKLGLV